MLIVKISIFIKAQRATNRKNTCKLRKQLPQFYNAHASNITTQPKKKRVANRKNACKLRTFVNAHAVNAHNTTKKLCREHLQCVYFIGLCCEHLHHLLSNWWKYFLDLLVLFLFASFFWSCRTLSSLGHRIIVPWLTTKFWTLIRI